MTAPARFRRVASAAGKTVALDSDGYVWALDAGCWRRMAGPAVAVRPKFVDLAVCSPESHGPWALTAVAEDGSIWSRLYPMMWSGEARWRPWLAETSRRYTHDDDDKPVEAPL
jgi:hypothetical protein